MRALALVAGVVLLVVWLFDGGLLLLLVVAAAALLGGCPLAGLPPGPPDDGGPVGRLCARFVVDEGMEVEDFERELERLLRGQEVLESRAGALDALLRSVREREEGLAVCKRAIGGEVGGDLAGGDDEPDESAPSGPPPAAIPGVGSVARPRKRAARG